MGPGCGEALAFYRLAFGQPRQEDMLAVLQRRGIAAKPERIAEIRIDLRPPPRRARSTDRPASPQCELLEGARHSRPSA